MNRFSPTEIRSTLDDLRSSPEAAGRALLPAGPAPRSVAVLPGAFDPPTIAHLALARTARGRGFDAVLFSLGTRTLDKEQALLSLEERALLLAGIADGEERLGLLLQNRGLYAGQAEAIERAIPSAGDRAFVVGMDKVPQLFDRRYYGDLEHELATLFRRARFLVAARGADGREGLEQILARPEARPFAGRFEWLDTDSGWRDVSATAVRERLARGEDVSAWLPPGVEPALRTARARSRV